MVPCRYNLKLHGHSHSPNDSLIQMSRHIGRWQFYFNGTRSVKGLIAMSQKPMWWTTEANWPRLLRVLAMSNKSWNGTNSQVGIAGWTHYCGSGSFLICLACVRVFSFPFSLVHYSNACYIFINLKPEPNLGEAILSTLRRTNSSSGGLR